MCRILRGIDTRVVHKHHGITHRLRTLAVIFRKSSTDIYVQNIRSGLDDVHGNRADTKI